MNLLERLFTQDGTRHDPLPGAYDKPEPYIADEKLAEAVNIALYLRRPLLLEGEPGCGKTRLAYAVAYQLGYPLKTCYIRSVSRAQDMLYSYDQLKRLYDIQERKTCGIQGEPPPKTNYRQWRELGEAIRLAAKKDRPCVVLIDEIDKADIDFPNDLLLVLDEWKFKVEETDETVDALKDNATVEDRKLFLPLVIITSNREKELPAPFLRRCLYYYIDFPEPSTLDKILDVHFAHKITPLFEKAVNKFMALRTAGLRWRKIPSTSELIDWIKILERDEKQGRLTADHLASYNIGDLPYLEILVKTQSDRNALTETGKK